MNFSQLMMSFTVFSLMLTIVNLLPSVVTAFQDRYKDRLTTSTRELDKVFVHLKATHIMAGCLGVGVLLGWLTDSWILAIIVALVGLFAPKIALTVHKEIRSTQFDAQLMDALILMNNAMRSGLDISTGIELVATNGKPPISEEFGLVLNSYRLGASLDQAMGDMTNRIRSRSLETAVGAIVIQRETGGNLIKTFEQLIQTIREESKLQKKIRAISAQGRTQIMFLALFPWLLAGLFTVISPDMFKPALADPMGQAVLVGLIVWEAIGVLVTKRVVTVEV